MEGKDKLGYVSVSGFKSMILGFGETGQDALAFLYEYGAFVGKDKKKVPFVCHVFDNQMDKFMKGIRSHIPECRRRMGCIITMSKSEQMTFGLSLVNIWLTRTIWLSVLVMIGVIWSWPAIL